MRPVHLADGSSFLVESSHQGLLWPLVITALVVSLSVAPKPVEAQSTFTSIDDPNGVPGTTYVSGISDRGTIAGTSLDASGIVQGFVRTNTGTFTRIFVPGSNGTNVLGINNIDQVFGFFYASATNDSVGFLWFQGSFQVISVPGSFNSSVNALSSSGEIAGFYNETSSPGGLSNTAFQLKGGQLISFSAPGQPSDTQPVAVNGVGQIIGNYTANSSTNGAFLFDGRTLSTIVFPGAQTTRVADINESGAIIGQFVSSNVLHGFTLKNSVYTQFDAPGASGTGGTQPLGINSLGDMVGIYSTTSGSHGFRLSGGSFTTIDFPGGTGTTPVAINDSGQIAGNYYDPGTSNTRHGFIYTPVILLDPIPYALNGPNVISDAAPATPPVLSGADLLLLNGRPVQGVGADGVTQAVILVPAANVGDQFLLTLFNDQTPTPAQSSLPNEDGALGKPGDTSFSQSQVTVTARATTHNGPYAFAEYRAPIDFARPTGSGSFKTGTCNGTTNTDDQLACRVVTVQVKNLVTNTIYTVPIQIVRPPVILIHGLWSDPGAFSNFLLTNGTPDSRFYRGALDYSGPPDDPIIATAPDYSVVTLLQKIKSNSLGLDYNAPRLMQQMSLRLQEFKSGVNPISAPVAAIQADILAHSMGGDLSLTISRMNAGQQMGAYERNDNLGQGDIHKLITIDTPYLGSPLALQLLQGYFGGISNDCVRVALALAGKFSLRSASLLRDIPRDGAIFDLQGDGLGSSMPLALDAVTDPLFAGPIPIPTALIAATASSANLAPIDTNPLASLVYKICGTAAGDPLALNLTSAKWPNVFGGAPNDVIVPFTSQVNRRNGVITTTILAGSLFSGVHGGGLELLGFAPPTVLDQGAVPAQVITLLNTPVTDPAYNKF